ALRGCKVSSSWVSVFSAVGHSLRSSLLFLSSGSASPALLTSSSLSLVLEEPPGHNGACGNEVC
ncbi:unnamed protein product, partial [Pleuronectes platessa]